MCLYRYRSAGSPINRGPLRRVLFRRAAASDSDAAGGPALKALQARSRAGGPRLAPRDAGRLELPGKLVGAPRSSSQRLFLPPPRCCSRLFCVSVSVSVCLCVKLFGFARWLLFGGFFFFFLSRGRFFDWGVGRALRR